MERLRKIGMTLWNNKELLILLALVGVFLYQVFKVLNPPEPEPWTPPRPPKPARKIDPEKEPVPQEILDQISQNFDEVKSPPYPPEPAVEIAAAQLVRANPFTVFREGASTTTGSQRPDKPQVVLDRIQPWRDGAYIAYLSVGGQRAKRYAVGETIDKIRLDRIDPDGQSVVVFSEEYNKTFTYSKTGG